MAPRADALLGRRTEAATQVSLGGHRDRREQAAKRGVQNSLALAIGAFEPREVDVPGGSARTLTRREATARHRRRWRQRPTVRQHAADAEPSLLAQTALRLISSVLPGLELVTCQAAHGARRNTVDASTSTISPSEHDVRSWPRTSDRTRLSLSGCARSRWPAEGKLKVLIDQRSSLWIRRPDVRDDNRRAQSTRRDWKWCRVAARPDRRRTYQAPRWCSSSGAS